MAKKVQAVVKLQIAAGKATPAPPEAGPAPGPHPADAPFRRFEVNLFVDNGRQQGAPVVVELNPSYSNLFGRVERETQLGTLYTDFTMIKAGSLHKANGGYLVINALDLLRNLFSYDALKRAVKNREVRIEDVWEQYRLVSTVTMKPEPIPLDVKVIVIGNPEIYYILYNWDEEYRELFKVKADFDNRVDRTEENIRRGLAPPDARAAARRKVGNTTQVAEEVHRMNTISFVEEIGSNVHFALRTMRRNPGFAFSAAIRLRSCSPARAVDRAANAPSSPAAAEV